MVESNETRSPGSSEVWTAHTSTDVGSQRGPWARWASPPTLQCRISEGSQRKTKTESIPPPYECVRRLGNKEYCDYVRILGEYVPMEKKENVPNFNNPEIKKTIFKVIQNKLQQIRKIPTTLFNADSIKNKFCYIPLSKALKYDIDFKPISYDVNMMRINEIDSLDKVFEKKKDFWQKYGSMIIIGGGIVMVIVIAYMSFEYMQTVISQTLSAADKVAGPLEALVNKISGSPPPT